MMKRSLLSSFACLFLIASSFSAFAQYPGWQQSVDCTMDIVLDTASHQYQGSMVVKYKNNSPETLDKLFWHLFFNAFQPGSMMDVRSRTIEDPDRRVGSRIAELPEDEWGWQRVKSVEVQGKPASFQHDGTILKVALNQPLKPGKSVRIEMTWSAQVPRQIRRSGWMNKEGVEYSMTQWYPKLCEFDHHGWHTNPYIGREFHGVWGDFDVSIHLPEGYGLAATGVKQSATSTSLPNGNPGTIHRYKADNVIDFAWAADPDFVESTVDVDGTTLRLVHQADPALDSNWTALAQYAADAMAFINEDIGPYAYPEYNVVQGGDGGMEYPMLTLITGDRSLRSLVGVTVHEMAHSWFQAMVATNESLHEWMDEGFTSWAESRAMASLFADPMKPNENPHRWAYSSYINHHLSGKEEPLATHADHYKTNRAYGVAAYSKGEVLVEQLGAIVGEGVRDEGMRTYFRDWSFKHPGPTDFKRVMERESDLELDWYFRSMIHSTDAIDYAVERVVNDGDSMSVDLSRRGEFSMPQDLRITWEDGSTTDVHIPLVIMRGHRPLRDGEILASDWSWVNPSYTVKVASQGKRASSVELDPAGLQADIDRDNNAIEFDLTQVQEANQSH